MSNFPHYIQRAHVLWATFQKLSMNGRKEEQNAAVCIQKCLSEYLIISQFDIFRKKQVIAHNFKVGFRLQVNFLPTKLFLYKS